MRWCSLLLVLLLSSPALAAERFVDRPMTQHRFVFAGDVGLGIGHRRIDVPDISATGAGFNLEGAFGITERLEVGLRTGIAAGEDARFVRADMYGRTLWPETRFRDGAYGTASDSVANPEARIRWVAYSGSVAEVGLDGRTYLPIEDNSRFGMMFGVPLAFHVSDFLRIDTGVYVPVVFSDPAFTAFSIPGYFWFQVKDKLWLGPMSSLRFIDYPGRNDGYDTQFSFGFGLGYQVHRAVDLKTQLLFPGLDDDSFKNFGVGFGVQFRINE